MLSKEQVLQILNASMGLCSAMDLKVNCPLLVVTPMHEADYAARTAIGDLSVSTKNSMNTREPARQHLIVTKIIVLLI